MDLGNEELFIHLFRLCSDNRARALLPSSRALNALSFASCLGRCTHSSTACLFHTFFRCNYQYLNASLTIHTIFHSNRHSSLVYQERSFNFFNFSLAWFAFHFNLQETALQVLTLYSRYAEWFGFLRTLFIECVLCRLWDVLCKINPAIEVIEKVVAHSAFEA